MTLEVTATVANPAPANFFIDFTFDWLDEGDISVYKNGSATAMARSTWKFITRERIEVLSGNFAADDSFKLLRETQVGSSAVTFVPGASIRAQDLNQNQQQVRFVSEELNERSVKATGGSMTGNLELQDSNIVFEGANADDHETTLTVVEPTADRTISLPNVGGTLPVLAAASTTQITATPEELNTLDGITSTVAELNIMDGVTATAAELNHVDGVTSNVQTQLDAKQPLDAELTELATMGSTTAAALADLTEAEVQILDGATVSTAELNLLDGVTATTTELNLVDGVTATTAELNILDGVTSTAAELNLLDGVTSTTAELNILDGVTATAAEINILDGVTSTAAELNLLDGRSVSGATISTNTTTQENELPTTEAVVAYVTDQLDQVEGFVAIATEVNFPTTQPPEGVAVSIGDVGGLEVDQNGQATNARTDGNGSDNITITGIEANFRPTSGTRAVADGVRFIVISSATANQYTYHKATLKESDLINLSTDIEDFGNRYRVSGEEPDTGLDDGDLWWDTANDQLNAYDGAAWAPVTASGEFIRLLLRDTDGTAPTFDGSVRDYNLVREDDTSVAGSITTAQQLLLSVDGVMQRPNPGTEIAETGNGFCRVDADTIQLAGAPEAGAVVFAVQMGTATEINTPAEDSVDSQHYVDDSIDSQHLNSTNGSEAVTSDVIRDDAVTDDKLADSTDTDADRAVGTNHIKDANVTQAKIANEAINEARLQVSNAPTNGRFLQAQSGNTGGLTWAEISSTAITNGTSNVSVAASGDITATRAGTTRLTVNSTGIEVDGVADFDSTDAILLPTGTTDDRNSTTEGAFRYSTTLGALEYYNGTNWILSSAATPTITSITGNILVNTATTLTINGSDFGTANLDVRFVQAADSIDETVTVTPTSQTQASVAVPANVRNNVTNGNVVTITVESEAGLTSDGFSQTAIEFPSGGDSITTSGDFRIHTFTSGGTFVNTVANLDVEYLIIAGGGGGGGNRGGGGGAGGYRTNVSGQTSGGGASAESSMTLTNTGNFTVTVGAGGTAGGTGVGGQGGDSTFNSITASGGGLGRTDDENGADGGSGAGAGGGGSFSGGAGTAGQGHDGADSSSNSFSNAGSSGGGAGSAGTTTTGGTIGSGGAGVSSNITGTAVTRASGGGGGSSNSSGNASAQTGGGADGGNSGTAASDATANTGGGGGGGGTGGGSAGGSGLVIIRYDTTTI